jgi:hypothetical protein
VISATPFLISTLNAVILAGICGLGALELGGGRASALITAAVAFAVGEALQAAYARRRIGSLRTRHVPLFPTGGSS